MIHHIMYYTSNDIKDTVSLLFSVYKFSFKYKPLHVKFNVKWQKTDRNHETIEGPM